MTPDNNHSTSATRISRRDGLILAHVARNRISTCEVLHQLFFPEQQPNAVTKVTLRLTAAGYLRSFPLYHPRTYFTLGPAGAQRFGLSDGRTRPLGPQSLPLEYGVLSYATRGDRLRQRLIRREIEEYCPDLPDGLYDQPHCINEGHAPPRLEIIRVDLGGRPDHIARKCQADAHARHHFDGFRRLLEQERLVVVIVTGTTVKAASIRDALDNHVWPAGLQFRLAVVPDLLPLIAGGFDA